MLEFIKSLNLSDELRNNDIYNLFKTDSSELNLKFCNKLLAFSSNLFVYRQ